MKHKSKTLRISFLTLLVISFLFEGLQAQSRRDLLVDGDFFYEMQNYPEATENYFRASQEKSDFQSLFNLAVSQEKQIDTGEGQNAQQTMNEPEDDPNATAALKNYQASMNYTKDNTQKSLAFYNMGNTILIDKKSLSMEKMEQAIEYFKSAIRFDNNNDPARHNLTIAQIMLDRAKQQEQQQQQEQSEDQEQKEDQEQNPEDQENKDNQDQKQNEDQEQKDSKEDAKAKEEKEKEMKDQKQKVDENEIENILKMVEKEDKEVQNKMRSRAKSRIQHKKKKW